MTRADEEGLRDIEYSKINATLRGRMAVE